MKQITLVLLLIVLLFSQKVKANEPDSAYLFSYTTLKNNGHNGLHYAWSVDRKNWQGIGSEFRFLFCDFGTWGSQKRMLDTFLFQDQQGTWHAIWSLNEEVGQFAHAETDDLYTWEPQSYPEVMTDGNVMLPEVSFRINDKNYLITWLSDIGGIQKIFKTTTIDFKTYSPKVAGSEKDRINAREEVLVDGEKQLGVISKVSWSVIDGLIKFYELSKFREIQRSERLTDDAERFTDLKDLKAEITVDPENSKAISDLLIGVFFEDINYAADGGLYAELIQNRGFEYNPADTKFRDRNWNSKKAWSFTGSESGFTIDTLAPVHPNQKHYAVLNITNEGEALENEGFDGIQLNAGDKYNFSVFAKGLNGVKGKLLIRLVDENGKIYAEASTKPVGTEWKKQELVLTANESIGNARLQVVPQFTGKVALDMISLFPQQTFKGRKNGLRPDLAQAIADLHPRFVRFPGGCVSHGDGLDNIYRWKNTIGPLESRKPDRNIWNYHQSMGLGYFEYFQFCEDIGAEPLPVIAAGVPCQNSSTGGHGQQGGIPMCDMDQYVQDILDLIEWANGDKSTKWGKLRAEAGHPEPFNLKYVGIGNEDLITDIFEERFTMIFNAIKEKYPEIIVIGTVGPFSEGTDYRVGWEIATKLQVPLVDEHYYQPPGWYLNNQDFYDRYDRSKPKVYLGEYATHIPGRRLNMETALCDALHLINVERNADVVSMTSYAPLLAKHEHTQWNPDLIYFNNSEVFLTTDYYVQKLFGQNSGDEYFASSIWLSTQNEEVKKRVASSVVYDSKTDEYILKLANLLPVKISSKINLADLPVIEGEAELITFQGEVNDEKAKPEARTVSVSSNFEVDLPAYSFSVIRMKSE
ncbi:alpha-L-arabinofuranosidase C-terminal domain-containing protein [Maribellus sp. YY47]|uniref:alpha-L-arabinofuranosidase C-terminal domain-containing protein n=1 Tax=Maribellus sp. YY47 TaxID=2929486 RepID=UPI0020005FCB|nr:alpha-L-arabinofuranosidase C-terminal domain-containing protein [Maribellus sp. YY47]MCK3684403.1 alpha-L-arabinofuranosidase [Maribellus sp. YY47]